MDVDDELDDIEDQLDACDEGDVVIEEMEVTDMHQVSQLVVDSEELGILGSVMKSYDEMNDDPDSNKVEFILGDSGHAYMVTVKRLEDSCKGQEPLSPDLFKPIEPDLKLVKKEPVEDVVCSPDRLELGEEPETDTVYIEDLTSDNIVISKELEFLENDDVSSDHLSGKECNSDFRLSDSDDGVDTPPKKKPKSKRGKVFKCRHCSFTAEEMDCLFDHIAKMHSDDSAGTESDSVSEDVERKGMKTRSRNKRKPKGKSSVGKKGKKKSDVPPPKKFKSKSKSLQKFLDLLNEDSTSVKCKKEMESDVLLDCDFCSFTCYDQTKLFRHIGLEHAHDPLSQRNGSGKLRTDCIYCNFTATRRKGLMNHLRTKHSGQDPKFKCDKCNYKTFNKSNFDRHIEVVHDKKRDVKCPECDYLTTRNYLLQKHILYKHKGIMPYRCTEPGCNFGHTSSSICKAHIMEVHKNYLPHKCTVPGCHYATSLKYMLKSHLYKTHRIGIPKSLSGPDGQQLEVQGGYQCPHCSHISKQKGNLKRHVDIQHLGVKAFKCTECSFTSATKYMVDNHMAEVHRGQYAFNCDKCTFKTNSKQRFRYHFTAVHLKEKPYQCQYCDYKGGQPTHLKRHIEVIHLGEKPHYCVYCQFNTAHKGNLKAHLKSIHKVGDENIRQVLKSCVDLRKKKRRTYKNSDDDNCSNLIDDPSEKIIGEVKKPKVRIVQQKPKLLVIKGQEFLEDDDISAEHGQEIVIGSNQVESNIHQSQIVTSVEDDLEALEASLVLEQIGQQLPSSSQSYNTFDHNVEVEISSDTDLSQSVRQSLPRKVFVIRSKVIQP